MRDLISSLLHLIMTVIRLSRPGGARPVVAESLLLKHQLIVLNRPRQRAPALCRRDRIIAGLCAAFISPARLLRSAIVLRPSTILSFHRALVKRKYRELFSPKTHGKPGPKGPSPEVISAIVAMKHRNPEFGYQRIADQIALVFDIEVDKDTVRRVLANHYRPEPGSGGPSWLTFLGHSKDSLWSIDLFRCESLIFKTLWVMVVMDHFTRQTIGFTVHSGTPDGPAVCQMLGRIVRQAQPPTYLSLDNDPLFEFQQWKANLRILGITEIKSVPYVPLSHPFVERLIGTIRREFLDQVPFWGAVDLQRKLLSFQQYYNRARVHQSLGRRTPDPPAVHTPQQAASLNNYQWESHCRGLFQLPIAA
jgi:putative transposase